MEAIQLNSGVSMPLIGLGTWDLRGGECTETVVNAVRHGYRLIDTAQMYQNEPEVGQGIRNAGVPRSELFVTTKIYRISNSYEKAKAAIDKSLQNLGLDYVDLLLLHEPYQQGADMYRAMEEAYQAGKTRAIGVSNYDEQLYAAFLPLCRIVPAVNQVEAHIYYQKWALQSALQAHGTAMQAWSPLAQGIGNVAGHPILTEIGHAHSKTAAQVALRFLVQRGISIIPKTKRDSRLRENSSIFDFSLSDDEMLRIKGVDHNDTLFPWTKTFTDRCDER